MLPSRRLLTGAFMLLTVTPALAFSDSTYPQQIDTIAFGSCADENKPQPIWEEIAGEIGILGRPLGQHLACT